MLRVDFAAEQVEGEPAPVVFKLGLLHQAGRAVRFAQVLGLHQQGIGCYFPNGLHGFLGTLDVVELDAHERLVVEGVRVPDTIEATEASRG